MKHGYARAGDVVTLTMSVDDYETLLLHLGIAGGAVSKDNQPAFLRGLALLNRINEGSPDWTPYVGENGKAI